MRTGPTSPTGSSFTDARNGNEVEHVASLSFDSPARHNSDAGAHNDQASDRCVELAESICEYFKMVDNAYESNPVQMRA